MTLSKVEYIVFVDNLCKEKDKYRFTALLDDILNRECGREYSNDIGVEVLGAQKKTFKNTTDRNGLKEMIVTKIWEEIEAKEKAECFFQTTVKPCLNDVQGYKQSIFPNNYIKTRFLNAVQERWIEEWTRHDEQCEAATLPPELATPEVQKYLQKAIEQGCIERSQNGLKWTKTKAMLAYFVDKINKHLGLRNQWRIYEDLFGVKNLAQTRYHSEWHICKVKGGDIIDQIFK